MVSAIYASVNLISGAISALPMHVYSRATDGERARLPSDSLWWILNEQMTPRWQAAAGWEFMTQGLLFHGDGFARIQRNYRGEVVGLEPIHPLRVRVVPSPDGSRLIYGILPDTTVPNAVNRVEEIVDQDDMIHVPGFGFDGCRGLSPLRYALRMAGAVAITAQDYSANFFENSARPDLVLETDQAMTPEKVTQLREAVEARHQSSANAARPMLLTNGIKAKVISMPIDDMQLLETRKFQIEEIARIYGIPPFMIGHNEKTTSWGSGVGEMGTGFVRYALRQHLNKFQNEINRKLFRTASKVAEFDTTELERADTKAMFEAFRVALGRAGEPGFMTTNEVRRTLNMPRIDGGDTLSSGQPDAKTAQPPGA
jgi:HK97 family phage portal protein